MSTVILKGNIIHTPTMEKFECARGGYVVAVDNEVKGVFETLPEEYADHPVQDYGDCLIMPGMCDTHLHASQFAYRGLGLDMQLMEWLNVYAFPFESKYEDREYAEIYYDAFANALAANGTTRAIIFSSKHVEGTEVLMDALERHKVASIVGKVNMDTFCPDYICEDTQQSIKDTEEWILRTKDKYKYVKPSVSPRFIPTCTSEVLKACGEFAKKYDLPVHTHSTEDLGEIEVSLSKHPEFETDSDIYDSFGLLTDKTVLAHFIYANEHEMDLIKERGCTIAICAQSHGNVAAGVPPTRKMIEKGIKLGLGSDIAGGYSVNIWRAMADAVYLSKIRYLESNKEDMFLNIPEAFYLGTKGGGQVFGKVGSFEEGYEFDALVIDDSNLRVPLEDFSLEQRIERIIHLGDDRNIIARFVAGEKA